MSVSPTGLLHLDGIMHPITIVVPDLSLLTALSCLAEFSSHCFNSSFFHPVFKLFFTVFFSLCYPVWFSMDPNHVLLCCDPSRILPGAELLLFSRGWNSHVSLQLNGCTLWSRKTIRCGFHMSEKLNWPVAVLHNWSLEHFLEPQWGPGPRRESKAEEEGL